MERERCPEYEQLEAAILTVLEKINAISTALVRAFHEKDHLRFSALDRALEEAVGEKERKIGALRQHVIDHGCQQNVA